jgi:hypothetical protein
MPESPDPDAPYELEPYVRQDGPACPLKINAARQKKSAALMRRLQSGKE